MLNILKRPSAAVVFLVAAFGIFATADRSEQHSGGIGDAGTLQAAYARWEVGRDAAGLAGSLVLPLTYVKGLSHRYTDAGGRVTIALTDGSVRAEVTGLDAGQALELYLVDNQPGADRSVRPEPGDVIVRLGRLEGADGTAVLESRLDSALAAGFELDLVVAGLPGLHPRDGGLLFGTPTLFQKLSLRPEPETAVATVDPWYGGKAASAATAIFRALVPPAHAAAGGGGTSMQRLIDRGEDIFFNEQFDGNGRTCGTCHPATNNFTLDPAFIATLPDDDPLFVAENNEDLAENFEKPELMRSLGLILENVDGFDNLDEKFVMRGVTHTLALPTSMSAEDPAAFPAQKLGWDGGGAPGSGSLREFAIGAVVQHAPRTLNRVAGADFRLPTDAELDALEAFQLSLGRREDPDLAALTLRNLAAATGKELFTSKNCNLCHLNAGANTQFAPSVNQNFNTNTEGLLRPPDRRNDEEPPEIVRPVDGGFGTSPGSLSDGFGDGTFNTTPLIEAADTPPFFHNNAVATLEEAVAFYGTPTFNNVSPIRIQLSRNEADQISAFLRVLNVLENVRSALALAEKAEDSGKFEGAARLLVLAVADTNDAILVHLEAPTSTGLPIAPAIAHLTEAANLLLDASETRFPPQRQFLIGQAKAELEAARSEMLLEVG